MLIKTQQNSECVNPRCPNNSWTTRDNPNDLLPINESFLSKSGSTLPSAAPAM